MKQLIIRVVVPFNKTIDNSRNNSRFPHIHKGLENFNTKILVFGDVLDFDL